MKRLSLDVG